MSAAKPPTTGNAHRLPFEALSAPKFEELCLWLVRREGYERAEYLGEAGSEQGRDVLAWNDGERVVFQCKRVKDFGLATAKHEIDKLRGLAADERPGAVVFVVSQAVSAKLRKEIRTAWGSETTCEFWSGGELDERVKRHPEIVREFFQVDSGTPSPKGRNRRRSWLDWGLAVSAVGLLATLAAWFWPFSPKGPLPKPAIYAVRVQVTDPEGRPIHTSTVRSSAGNEPQGLPDGWWEVEIPSAKMPATGRVTLRADHPDWEGNQTELVLGTDPNPSVEVRLKPPTSWLRGRVTDAAGRSIEGVRVSPADGSASGTTTDFGGRFELSLPLPRGNRVRVRAEPVAQAAVEVYCYSGRDSCQISLEEP